MEQHSIDSLAKVLDAKIEKSVMSAKDNVKGEVEESLKTEIKNIENTISEGQKKLAERMDVFEMNNKKNSTNAQGETKSFKNALSEALKDGAIDSLKKGNTHKSSFEIKADMTTADNFTGEVIAPTRVPGFKFDPATPTHVRTLLSTGTTNSDTIRYVKESAYTNNAGATAEGSQLGQSEFDLTAETKNVELIGTYMRISRQMLEDTDQLTSYLSARVPSKLLTTEDDQLLGGSGVSPNLHGLRNTATVWSTTNSGFGAGSFTTPNEFDVLLTAMSQVQKFNYSADAILLNPIDFYKIIALKDSDNRYLKDNVYAGLEPRFMGVPVVTSTSMTAGEFIVGNFAQSAQLWVRENVNVEFFEQDSDNVQKNFITVRVQERIALTTYLPNGLCRGVFATVKGELD